MNWAEAFQAMSEGKTVSNGYGVLYRVHDGVFQTKLQNSNYDWSKSIQLINDWIRNEYKLAIEYNLTFIEAMNKIQKGHKVECMENPGTLVYLDEDGDVVCSIQVRGKYASFDSYEVKSKWRVVEEEDGCS